MTARRIVALVALALLLAFVALAYLLRTGLENLK